MPDELETLLRTQRLDFTQPPMATITARARVLRRRRRAVRAGALALSMLAVAVPFLVPGDTTAPQVAASSPAPPGGVWAGGGITINGLPGQPRDLPGTVRDAQFIDADRGFLLTSACTTSCTVWLNASTDGGRTWSTVPVPGTLRTYRLGEEPSLVVTGSRVTVVGAAPAYTRTSTTDGAAWDTADSPPVVLQQAAGAALPGDARLLLHDGRLLALLHDGTSLVAPPTQPPLTISWVSPVRAGDGSWWVAGSVDGQPAVAVSRDGGGSWTPTPFPGAGTARVSFLGRDVYVTLLDPATRPATLLGVAGSTDGGASFGQPRALTGTTVGGEVVPLLDGRLLLVDGTGHWLLSTDRGVTWQRVSGLHPTERLARTQTGWVAYGMSTIYTAYSVDGSTWQKLDAQ